MGRRPEVGLARCGLRSGVAARENAELVPLWVGKYDPALVAGWPTSACRAPRPSRRRTSSSCSRSVGLTSRWSRFLTVLPSGTRAKVSVGGTGPGWFPPSGTIGEPMVTDPVVFVLHLVAKDRAPEPGETARIGTVDRKLGELTGHVRTSQPRSESAEGHTLIAGSGGEASRVVCVRRGPGGVAECRMCGGTGRRRQTRQREMAISQCAKMTGGDLGAGAHGERIDRVHHRKQRLLQRWPLRGADSRGR